MIASTYMTFYVSSSKRENLWGGVSLSGNSVGSSDFSRGHWSQLAHSDGVSRSDWNRESMKAAPFDPLADYIDYDPDADSTPI